MKKNILVVQTLLLLPLMTSSVLLGMNPEKEKKNLEKPIERKNRKKNGLEYQKREIRQVTEEKTLEANDLNTATVPEDDADVTTENTTVTTVPEIKDQPVIADTDDETKYNEFPFLSDMPQEESTTDVSKPKKVALHETITIEEIPQEPTTTVETIPNDLLQSVIMSKEEKGLSWREKITYYTSTSSQVVQNITNDLTNNSFDTKNSTHLNILKDAINTTIANDDFDSLAKIIALCQSEKYQNLLRIDDDVARLAFNFCKTKYTATLNLSNKTIEDNRQNNIQKYNTTTLELIKALNETLNKYNQDIKNISVDDDASYKNEFNRAGAMHRSIMNFSKLNLSIRQETKEFLKNDLITVSTKEFAQTVTQANTPLKQLLETSKQLPQMKDSTSKLSKHLQLENK